MKKSVILIIGALSLVAIIVIGLLFQRAEVYNVTIYVSEIICSGVRVGDDYYDTYFDESVNVYRIDNPDNPGSPLTLAYAPGLTVDIIYEVLPFEATNQSVSFSTDPNSFIARVESTTGRVFFIDEGTETFTIRANDNSNKSAKVRLRAKIPDA
ncbi:MAG TPA: hypothetical protein PL058_02675 [Bacilli bacterium]|nr:hypothetical protein [Bacilli bacterium]HPK67149.1 hypothetical protein [Bacilli bacterium]